LRDGGGTRLKVLDALALGMPVVASSIACEGLAVTPEHNLLVADSPDEFVTQIGRLFEDQRLAAALSERGRELAVTRYAWDVVATNLVGLFEEAASSGRPNRLIA
jgi:glycosyltransferase involved in cell wall biosynthesis